MGKKRITQLLEQLEANQQQEMANSAAIYTVAQMAVNHLQEQMPPEANGAIAALPTAPVAFDQATLEQRYGSYNNCRKAAKQQGIKFSGTPSWAQLVAAFSYAAAFQELAKSYLETHPHPHLHRVSIELKIP